MKKTLLILTVLALLCPVPASALNVRAFKNCRKMTEKDSIYRGNFLWKPVGAHFTRAVIVAPRYYFPERLDVELWANGKKIRKLEEADLKSTGDCNGNPECLFAATFLTNWDGNSYRRAYRKGIIVKIDPDMPGSRKECRYYMIPRPDRRTTYR